MEEVQMNEEILAELPEGGAKPEMTEEKAADESAELRAALLEANIKLALLLSGAAREKLSEAARLAEGLCALGAAPEEAAAEIMGGYPHLKAVQREIPQLSAQTGGSDDGFSMIRSIFARR